MVSSLTEGERAHRVKVGCCGFSRGIDEGRGEVTRQSVIYTLGTSTRSPEEFTQLLRSHGVEVVVDVRRFATSRFEYFRGENLARLLDGAGIDYVNMGQQLGGYRRGGYQAFATTAEFQAAVKKIGEVARRRRVAVVCAERFPWRCHRRFIGIELEKQGWQVSHIIDRGRDWLPGKSKLASPPPATLSF